MFTRKRSDTRIDTIEAQYGVNMNTRGDTLLGNLLEQRGFDSLTQLLDAYWGRATQHARSRRVFLSFHAEDRAQVQGFRLMMRNPNLGFDVHDESLRTPIDSEQSGYVKSLIRPKIERASVLMCLVGNGTAWREWVDWEIRTAVELGKGLCGVRLKGSTGRAPPLLGEYGADIVKWGDHTEVVAAIEQAAARRT
jgi:hypothetical protein